MDLIETIRNDKELVEKIMKFFDIEIYPKEQKPDDFNGSAIWNIDGMAFGCDASGGEYILLKDNTIGFNSSEGECGRLAENITELFELILNISCWMDYLYIDLYENDEMMNKYITKAEKDYEKDYNKHFNENNVKENNYKNIQNTLLEKLSIKICDNKIELLKRFYKTANREPKYIYTFTEEDGTKINSEGSLINRLLYDHVKKRMGL
jgi:hypothetical protein